jgi:hypothetical protein
MQQLLGAHSRVVWPPPTQPLTATHLPAVIVGARHSFLGATFHITAFDRKTTSLEGFIDLTNLTAAAATIVLCLEGPSIAYHIEMLDANENLLFEPNGIVHNWKATTYHFDPHEAKRMPLKIRLRDGFELKPGLSQLIFTFDERLIRQPPQDEYPIKSWSRERLILESE